ALPTLDRVAVSVLFGEQRAAVEERAYVLRVEAQHAPKCVHCIALLPEREERFAQCDQRLAVVRIALEQIDQQRDAFRRSVETASQHRQLKRCFGVSRHGIERGDELRLRFALLSLALE